MGIFDILSDKSPDRSFGYSLLDNILGFDDGKVTPGEKLGAAVNQFASNPIESIMGMGSAVKADLDDLMFRGGAERRPQDVLGYAAAPMAPGAIGKRAANVMSSGGARPKKGIKAYHGSPHDFDRFSMDKIGTGEGAQAYGHGLYFAENEAVAKGYRDTLAPGHSIKAGGAAIDNLTWLDQSPTQKEWDVINAAKSKAKASLPNGAPKWVEDGIAKKVYLGRRPNASGETLAWNQTLDSVFSNISPGGREAFSLDDQLAIEKYAAALRDGLPNLEVGPSGTMYEVRINADPDDFLDWDAPITETPESFQNWVRKRMDEVDLPEGTRRQRQLAAWRGDWVPPEGMNVPPPRVAEVRNWLGDYGENQVVMTEALRDAGIPGIKYRDAGSRGMDGQSGTRNFVVFDENLIEIVRKYGIAGAAAMMGISAQELQAQIAPQGGIFTDMEPTP